MKFNDSEAIDNSTDEKSSQELLDSVIHELNDGRTTNEVSAELVRQKWTREAANRFCELASKICREMKFLPDHRAACAKRGYESMQGSYGWIGFGICATAMMYLVGNNARNYALFGLLPVLYGVVELVSGFLLWWPHREFQKHEAIDQGQKLKKG